MIKEDTKTKRQSSKNYVQFGRTSTTTGQNVMVKHSTEQETIKIHMLTKVRARQTRKQRCKEESR